MYYISRNLTMPRSLRGPFFSYEKARQAIRKWIRANKAAEMRLYRDLGIFTSNPDIGSFGFSITKS